MTFTRIRATALFRSNAEDLHIPVAYGPRSRPKFNLLIALKYRAEGLETTTSGAGQTVTGTFLFTAAVTGRRHNRLRTTDHSG